LAASFYIFMGKITDYYNKLKSIKTEDIDKVILKVVDESKNQAIDLNTKQLFSGRDAKEQSLGGYRNQEYAAFKRSLNPAGVVDLKLTGAFYDGFFAKTDKFPVTFSSTDEKTGELMQKYGTEIFGLDQNNLEEFRQEIKPEVQKVFHDIFHL
jgi:hypothetical protein